MYTYTGKPENYLLEVHFITEGENIYW